jgi:hypothetical protein
MIISAKIDVSKIDKTKLFKGEKGTYLDITLLENRGGPDQYGNDFMVVQDLGKAARDKGEKGAILGNAKIRGSKPAAPAPQHAKQAPAQDNPHDIQF